MSDILKFTIPGKPDYVQMVRLAIASIAGKANYDVESVEDIKQAVAEACKTVFCHRFEGFSNSYEIVCEITDESMTITVSDCCSGHDIVKGDVMPCIKCPDDGDLAVVVMQSLMDVVSVSVDDDGNKSVRMVKNR
jgi:serine/threonine-protein kinase RsbW